MNKRKGSSAIVGIVFIILSLVFITVFRNNAIVVRASISGFFVGIFLVFVKIKYAIPEHITANVMQSTTSTLFNTLKGLNIGGKGIFVPSIGNIKNNKIFVPLHKKTPKLNYKQMDEESIFLTDDFSKDYGVFLNSPGDGLVDMYEEESEINFSNIGGQALCGIIKVMEGLDVVSSIEADFDDGDLKVNFSHSNYEEMCVKIRGAFPAICTQGCCPICSSILSSFAKAEAKPVEIIEVRKEGSVKLRARVLEWEK